MNTEESRHIFDHAAILAALLSRRPRRQAANDNSSKSTTKPDRSR